MVAFLSATPLAATDKRLEWSSVILTQLKEGRGFSELTCPDQTAAKSDYCKSLLRLERRETAKPKFTVVDPSVIQIENAGTRVTVERTNQPLEFIVNGEELVFETWWTYADILEQVRSRLRKSSSLKIKLFLEEAHAEVEPTVMTVLASALLVEGVRARDCDQLAAFARKCAKIAHALWIKGPGSVKFKQIQDARELVAEKASHESKPMIGTEKLTCTVGLKKKMRVNLGTCKADSGLLKERAKLCANEPGDSRCDRKAPKKEDVENLEKLDEVVGVLDQISDASTDPTTAAK